MKAIELMQKLGELVVAHGDIEVVLVVRHNPHPDFDFVRGVSHVTLDSPNAQDMNFIVISSRKEK